MDAKDIIVCGKRGGSLFNKPIPNFFDDDQYGKPHDTYRNQEAYVISTGNKWALENFNATRPYLS